MLYKKKRDTEGSCCLEPPSSSCQELSSWSAELRLEYLGTHAPVLPLLGLPVASLVHKVGLPGDGVPSLVEPQWLVAPELFAWMEGGGKDITHFLLRRESGGDHRLRCYLTGNVLIEIHSLMEMSQGFRRKKVFCSCAYLFSFSTGLASGEVDMNWEKIMQAGVGVRVRGEG